MVFKLSHKNLKEVNVGFDSESWFRVDSSTFRLQSHLLVFTELDPTSKAYGEVEHESSEVALLSRLVSWDAYPAERVLSLKLSKELAHNYVFNTWAPARLSFKSFFQTHKSQFHDGDSENELSGDTSDSQKLLHSFSKSTLGCIVLEISHVLRDESSGNSADLFSRVIE